MNVITYNLTAMNANRQLSISTDNKSEVAEKLSSGYRINRSVDDAVGQSMLAQANQSLTVGCESVAIVI